MQNICLVDFTGEERHGYILGSRFPKTDPAYSEYLDIGYNHQNFTWRDETPHYHKTSEAYFIVLQGQLDFLVQNRLFCVKPRQLLGIRSGMAHQISGGHTPIENFLIRVPGRGEDKISLAPEETGHTASGSGGVEPILLDINQPFSGYPLPENHPNHSPLLDFTCVWDVDPGKEWKNNQFHYHTLREEYFIVLRGRLDLTIDSSTISVHAGQIIGIKPPISHTVIGGEGPADVLFVRVPGGRGDKIVI